MFEPSSQITEILRAGSFEGCEKYMPELDEKYNKLIGVLEEFQKSKNQ